MLSRFKFLHVLVLVAVGLSIQLEAKETQVISHLPIQSAQDQYFSELIKLAIKHADNGHKYKTEEINQKLNQQQQAIRLNDGRLSIMWAGTTPDYEERLNPIRIPLLKGLQGHRIFIIRANDQARFSSINTFADLQQFKAGQGRFWGDTSILKNADLPVVTPLKKESLFYMVDGERFDYFPLAVHEPWSEVQSRQDLQLAVEKQILLIYPMAMYFFTGKDDVALANMLRQGLNRAVANGEFDKVFYNTPHIKAALKLANLSERKVFRIKNPNLPAATPLDRKELWLDIESDNDAKKNQLVVAKM
ncbi:diguanylate cyclase [Saccharobesus litoralis]|uniref:Diguanylate cyclase n=2 Tax=Saccharobesus litoralis TaxID=2172099 RepID=A0A2S0VP64_9ALTE|nr:diguanylate cyclase [Saccharobesus litoralis]